MKIGELAARTGMAASAIRFYEQRGLLPAATRGANGYRIYDESAEERLKQIQLAQKLGFTLDEMQTAIKEMGDFSQDGLLGRIDRRLGEIDALRTRLDEQRRVLLGVRDALQAEWAAGRCFKVDRFEERQGVARRADAALPRRGAKLR
ncbi:MerR family transcriptional regulator [Burkholderia sp. Ax-1724]|uniref:MerR family transcriptional regulator n=1 Tax=Burkholderia sp. Ax-1724 TaxID=2608336 RepID=UPI00141FE546|nr:MerR family transcriptional regulator [Burkholderia sp. Ax-1724]NIF55038.1 MerR family transcriptional regulator [Burkholderia sp. Ax-1724]